MLAGVATALTARAAPAVLAALAASGHLPESTTHRTPQTTMGVPAAGRGGGQAQRRSLRQEHGASAHVVFSCSGRQLVCVSERAHMRTSTHTETPASHAPCTHACTQASVHRPVCPLAFSSAAAWVPETWAEQGPSSPLSLPSRPPPFFRDLWNSPSWWDTNSANV